MTTAADGDTWGISGPTFIQFYLLLAAVLVIAAAVHRRRALSGGDSSSVTRLNPQQIAYLNGRDRLAVHTSLGGLRASGAIDAGPARTLTRTGPLPAGATPLDTAVHNAAGRQVRAGDMVADQWVAAALVELHQGLERLGLLTSREQRRSLRAWGWGLLALAVFGLIRAGAGASNDRPIGFILLAAVITLVVAVVTLARSHTGKTRAADRGLKELRQSNQHLSPAMSPSYATYGAAGAAMGVALFGTASLYAMDPAFASEAEIQRYTSGGSSTYYGGDGGSGSSDGGGGGGCGGGGCGG